MIRLKKITVLLFCLQLMGDLSAQAPKKFYTKFGGNGDDIGYSGKPTLDGQYIIAGSSTSYGTHGVADVYLLKVDSMGKALWGKFIGGTGNDVAKSVVQLPDSGFILAGYTSSFGGGGYDAYLIRTDKNGEVIWERTFGGVDWDFGADVVVTPNNFIFMVGNTTSFGAGKKDGFVVKYDLNGNFLTQKFFGGVENEELRSIINTDDNALATVGYTESRGNGESDCYFLKLDYSGDTIFTKVFGGPFKDYANDIVQKNNGEYNICGAGTFTSGAKTEGFIHTMTTAGTKLQEMHEAKKKEENEEFVSAANSQHKDYLTGYVRNVIFPSVKLQGEIFVLIPLLYADKISNFGEYGDDYAFSVEGTPDGGFLCIGSTLSFNSEGSDVFLVKYDTLVANYVSIMSVGETIKTEPLITNTNKKITIDFGNDFFQEVKLYDLKGNLIYQLTELSNRTEIQTSGFPGDVYLIVVNSEKGVFRKKVLLRTY